MRRINIDDERHKAIAEYYGNFTEMRKLSEELVELQVETGVAMRSVPTRPKKSMWSEMADVINCIIHVAMQWDKVDEVVADEADGGGEVNMERLTIPDEKIEGGMRRTVVDARKVRENAVTIYWALKKV